MHALEKTTQQTFVTLRRFAAAVAVLVVGNRLASATPANTISEKTHDFETNSLQSGWTDGPSLEIADAMWRITLSAHSTTT